MKKMYQELCLKIIQFDLDIITSSGDFADDMKEFNVGWLD